MANNRSILGENKTIIEYLSERLDCSVEVIEFIVGRYPSLLGIDYQKVSNFKLRSTRSH
jgi:hypothetical protein